MALQRHPGGALAQRDDRLFRHRRTGALAYLPLANMQTAEAG
jgi:hypothetical protein